MLVTVNKAEPNGLVGRDGPLAVDPSRFVAVPRFDHDVMRCIEADILSFEQAVFWPLTHGPVDDGSLCRQLRGSPGIPDSDAGQDERDDSDSD